MFIVLADRSRVAAVHQIALWSRATVLIRAQATINSACRCYRFAPATPFFLLRSRSFINSQLSSGDSREEGGKKKFRSEQSEIKRGIIFHFRQEEAL